VSGQGLKRELRYRKREKWREESEEGEEWRTRRGSGRALASTVVAWPNGVPYRSGEL